MYKFFEDRHIKVSLFIQDKIQGLDGTIYLDFCNVGPQHSVKPGTVKFFADNSNNVAREKQINLVHAKFWKPHPRQAAFNPESRRAEATKPHLGSNIYAADRKPLAVPWKLNSQADKEIENIRV